MYLIVRNTDRSNVIRLLDTVKMSDDIYFQSDAYPQPTTLDLRWYVGCCSETLRETPRRDDLDDDVYMPTGEEASRPIV